MIVIVIKRQRSTSYNIKHTDNTTTTLRKDTVKSPDELEPKHEDVLLNPMATYKQDSVSDEMSDNNITIPSNSVKPDNEEIDSEEVFPDCPNQDDKECSAKL